MATRDCIAAVSAALVAVLEEALKAPGGLGGDVQLYTSQSFREPMPDGISVSLYRLQYDPTAWNRPVRPGESGHRIAITAYYAVHAWSEVAIRQHQLFGLAAEVLARTPVLTAEFLNDHGPARDVFAPGEVVTLVPETPSAAEGAGVPGAQGLSAPALLFAVRGLVFGAF